MEHRSNGEYLAGASDLLIECRQMLAGQRRHFTSLKRYRLDRLRYWQARSEHGQAHASQPRQAA